MTGRRARGAVLLVCLVFLLVLTVMGASAVRTSVLEARLVGHQQDVQVAFQAAEAALRQGESLVAEAGADDVTAWWRAAGLEPSEPWRDPATWTGGGTGAVAGDGTARYLIEHLASIAGQTMRLEVFRITARGVGGRGDVPVLLQSTYGRLLPGEPADAPADGPADGPADELADEPADERPAVGTLRGGRLSWRELDG